MEQAVANLQRWEGSNETRIVERPIRGKTAFFTTAKSELPNSTLIFNRFVSENLGDCADDTDGLAL